MKTVDDRVGTNVDGRFQIVDVLGRGAGGVVYRAHQKALDRDVAIKVLERTDASDPELRERFKREAKAIASLRSEYTVALHDFGRLPDGAFYIVMELVEGATLEAVLDEEAPLPADRVRGIFEQISASLEEAHARGIVHRDVKPSNVMIQAADGRARLLDFGVSKSLEHRVQWTQRGELLGTPPYMAPEQWSPEFGEVSPATDVYALGAMLFEALTGDRPFRAETPPQWMKAHLEDTPSALPDDLEARASFDALVRDALNKSPDARPASAGAFGERLRSASVVPPPRKQKSARWVNLAMIGIAAVFFVRMLRSEDHEPVEPSVAVETTTVAEDPARVAPEPVAPKRRRPPRRKRAPTIDVAERIGFDADAARVVGARSEPSIRTCLGTARVERVRLMISAQGIVTSVRSEPASEPFDRCARQRLRDERFTPPRGNFAVVTMEVTQ